VSDGVPPRPDVPEPPGGTPQPPRPDGPDPAERTPRPGWRPLEAIPVLLIAFVTVAVVGSLVTALTPSCPGRFLLQLTVGELAFPLAVILWLRLVSHSPLAALGAPRRPLGDLATGFLGGLALIVVGYVAGAVVLAVARLILGHPPAEPEQISTCVRGAAFVASGFGVVVLAPVCEETFFRGFLYRSLRERLSPWPAALISGGAFALVHVDPLLIFSLLPVGVGLAFVYERRQSLLASIVAHATFNLVGLVVIALTR
jgi:uncharacterized protein